MNCGLPRPRRLSLRFRQPITLTRRHGAPVHLSQLRPASSATDRTAGFRNSPRAARTAASDSCSSCSTTTTRRPTRPSSSATSRAAIIGCGRGSRELTGLSDEKMIGRPVNEVLGLDFQDGDDPVGVALEWGVRQLAKPVTVHAEGDLPAKAVADLFPAYDDDGGLLLDPDAAEVGCPSPLHVRSPSQPLRPARRPRPDRRVGAVDRHQGDAARPRPPGRRLARLRGQADQAAADHHAEGLDRAVDIMRDRVDSLGVAEPEIQRSGENQIDVSLPGVENAERAEEQVGTTAQMYFYDWEPNVLDEDCKTNPRRQRRPAADQRPVQRGQARLEVPAGDRRQQHGRRGALLRLRQEVAEPLNDGAAGGEPRATWARTRGAEADGRRRSSRSPRASSSCATGHVATRTSRRRSSTTGG